MHVSPGTAELSALGATVQLSAEVRDQAGRAMPGAAVSWASADTTVATVDAPGLVTAVGNGAATVTATSGSASGTATVTVAQAVDSVVVSPPSVTVATGDTLRLSAEALDANGHPVAGVEFAWSSSDASVATVDGSGLVTGVGAGGAEIAAASSGVTGRAALSVETPAPATVTVAPDTVSFMALGDTARLSAEVLDQFGRTLPGAAVSWTSADASVAAVDSTGLVTAAGAGATTVTATADSVSGSAAVTVMQSAGSVVVSPPSATVAPGDTVRLSAEALDANGHPVAGAEFAWSSSDASVATVDGSGLVTGVAEGSATVRAVAGDARGTAEITVANPDRAALVALYEATDGPNWVDNTNWLSEAPLGDWYGVQTDASGRVVQLVLAGRWDTDSRTEVPHGLRGAIPPELGSLSNLRTLSLAGNDLSGPLPPELGRLTSLVELVLSRNAGLTGTLPAGLTNLRSLESLQAGGTMLCAPSGADFTGWLETIPSRRVALCVVESAGAYLVQAVQSREFPVPLVAREEALLRVFPTAARANDAPIPPVRASFFLGGALAHAVDIAGTPGPVPTEVDEGSLARSANAAIPAEVVRPGLELVVEIDPDGTLDAALAVRRRIPETGRLAVDVRTMPVFNLTVVPFLSASAPDSSVLQWVEGMAADPEGHELLWHTRTLLPVGDLEVAAHEPVVSSSNNAFDLLTQTEAIRVMEGGSGHYLGTKAGQIAGAAGVGYTPGRAALSVLSSGTIAHELGHNMNLRHAPCEASGPDPAYPYPDASIGAWGYDFRAGGRLASPAQHHDLMSYCHPWWISDYHFGNALRFRLGDEGAPASAAEASAGSLLLWGGVRTDETPYLEPAFAVEAPSALPDSAGDYRLTGHSDRGAVLFSLSFGMNEVADGDGGSSFAFVLPARPEWEDGLASITLTGPGGSFTLDAESDRPMAILRDPRTGQVRGFLRDLPPATLTRADAAAAVSAEPGLEVLFSRGIPDAEAWRR